MNIKLQLLLKKPKGGQKHTAADEGQLEISFNTH